MMPGLDGFGLLRELRADAELRDVPVDPAVGARRRGVAGRGPEAGADDYLVKPFSARELLARVDSQLKLAQLTAGNHGSDRHRAKCGSAHW